MKPIARGKRIVEITGAKTTLKQVEVLRKEGFAFWLDASDKPCMYDGQLPKQYTDKKTQPVNDNGFELPNVPQSKH